MAVTQERKLKHLWKGEKWPVQWQLSDDMRLLMAGCAEVAIPALVIVFSDLEHIVHPSNEKSVKQVPHSSSPLAIFSAARLVISGNIVIQVKYVCWLFSIQSKADERKFIEKWKYILPAITVSKQAAGKGMAYKVSKFLWWHRCGVAKHCSDVSRQWRQRKTYRKIEKARGVNSEMWRNSYFMAGGSNGGCGWPGLMKRSWRLCRVCNRRSIC